MQLMVGENPPRNPRMVMIEAYLNLVNRTQFTLTGEVKRLWLLRSGVLDGSIVDVRSVLSSMEDAGLMDEDLSAFFNLCLSTNLKAMSDDLVDTILRRTRVDPVDEAPAETIIDNESMTRRTLYYPTMGVLKDLNLVMDDFVKFPEDPNLTNGSRLLSVSVAVDLDLDVINDNTGVGFNRPACPDLVRTTLTKMSGLIHTSILRGDDYHLVIYPLVRIQYVIARMMLGDIDTRPMVPPTEAIDILRTIRISDATLAASPCPTLTAVETVSDLDEPSLSHLGYRYLSAVQSYLTDCSR